MMMTIGSDEVFSGGLMYGMNCSTLASLFPHPKVLLFNLLLILVEFLSMYDQ